MRMPKSAARFRACCTALLQLPLGGPPTRVGRAVTPVMCRASCQMTSLMLTCCRVRPHPRRPDPSMQTPNPFPDVELDVAPYELIGIACIGQGGLR